MITLKFYINGQKSNRSICEMHENAMDRIFTKVIARAGEK